MSRRAAFTLGALLLAIAAAGVVYLVVSERSSDRRVDAAVAGLHQAGEQAALADDYQAAAGLAPSAAGRARLGQVVRRAEALAERARSLPDELDPAVARQLDQAARSQLASARALLQTTQPAGAALKTIKHAGSDPRARRALQRARRELARVKAEVAPARRRYAAILGDLRLALDGLSAQLAEQDELDSDAQSRLADAKRALEDLERESSASFGGATSRLAASQASARQTIARIDRRLAASRRAERQQRASPGSPSPPAAPPKSCPSGESLLPTGTCYDPSPPPAGSYGGMEEFCRDQPEETECGGPGDPRETAP